jgi:hypothetical protein
MNVMTGLKEIQASKIAFVTQSHSQIKLLVTKINPNYRVVNTLSPQ